MSDRPFSTRCRNELWDQDEAANANFKPLSRLDAERLKAQHPGVSPWRVVATQVVLGVVMALIGVVATGQTTVGWSMLYGAAVAVVPGALMARGMTSRLSSISVGSSVVSVMLWTLVKMGFSVLMLFLAPRLVQPLSWPALLIALGLCLQVYWVALLWRGRRLA